MLAQIIEEFEQAREPLALNELSRRISVERSALDGIVEYLVRKGRMNEIG